MHDDIVEVFAFLYLDGNKKKALSILDSQKEISWGQFAWICLFSGGSFTQILSMLLFAFGT